MIAQGPVASQEVIKILGTNGGGFFNANSAHPYENPTALTNFVQLLLIFSIGAGLTNVFGRIVGSERQGWAIYAVMFILFPCAERASGRSNMEGKEVRFGIPNLSLFTTITTDATCGAVNTMHDSLLPLAGMVPLALGPIVEHFAMNAGSLI